MTDNPYKNKVEITVRAVIICGDEVLLCKYKSRNYLFFPGGHINFSEKARDALNRELREEAGISFKKWTFIGVAENIYQEDFQKHHEIVLAFVAKTQWKKIKDQEDDLEFFWKNKSEIAKEKILPVALAKMLPKWLAEFKS